jgi:hypothetical protein
MRRAERSRIEQLARRVGWLDRRRRPIAILCAALSAPLTIAQIDDALGADWPREHALAMTLMAGALLWIAIEIGLAGLIALWETEHNRLLRDRGLPRAQLRKRR